MKNKQKIHYQDGSTIIEHIDEFNQNDILIKKIYYTADGKTIKHIDKYGHGGDDLVEETYYNADNTIDYILKHKYDVKNGNLISTKEYDSNMKLVKTTQYHQWTRTPILLNYKS